MKTRLSQRAQKVEESKTIALTMKARELRKQGIDISIFGQGEPDFTTPPHIIESAYKALKDGYTKYTPVAGFIELREAIARKLKRENDLDYDPKQIVVSGGAKHSLINIILAVLDPGDEVIIPVPAWLSYWEQVKLADAIPVLVPTKQENDFKLTAEALQAAITPKTKLLILNSPGNPTGSVYTKEELAAIADICISHDLLVLSDEIYEKLIYDGQKHVSIGSLSKEMLDRTIVVNGFSKAFAMTGWRMGYAAAPLEIAKAMDDLQSQMTSNPTSFVQLACIEALEGTMEPIDLMIEEYDKRRALMVKLLQEIPGIECTMPKGAFYVFPGIHGLLGKKVDGEVIEDDEQLTRILLEKAHILVVPGSSFGMPNHIRLSYATDVDTIVTGMEKFKKFVSSL
ncbi:pyridoxal phosphate-dependent aminotransferase [Ammoniphilus sp. CFH 90114]|uniref:pyridoxal phosphate-dependent aminotransferase n=1 Tax=Ammoniphilus sp. CFH 90114 TaxID=2493665 RepID=UPI00100E8F94|nr:pyridoxal phosphate-dependent aminotransferase [Ammoniphilus sp. CFH 90114]RXT02804.1 pyridoxal phosphate-dependent aminotransferase [Ammoniphilus sp. CFH 90114]